MSGVGAGVRWLVTTVVVVVLCAGGVLLAALQLLDEAWPEDAAGAR